MKQLRARGLSILALALLGGLPPALASTSPPPFRVVIDPGHGGVDEGAVIQEGSRTIAEKTLTLALAKEAARSLRTQGIEAVLTRTYDTDVSLPLRTAMANRLQADLFLSIHLNSGPASDAQGVETYILNTATDASSRRLQELENSVVRLAPEGSDGPHDPDVALILKDLRLDANLGPSQTLACSIQGELVKATRHRNRGVKQALFYVLLGADMPSALVEAGFLTSPRDRANLTTSLGQSRIGRAIAQGVERFRRSLRAAGSSAHPGIAMSNCKAD